MKPAFQLGPAFRQAYLILLTNSKEKKVMATTVSTHLKLSFYQ